MDRLFHEGTIKQFIFDKLNNIDVSKCHLIKFIRHYDNPDMFYLDKTAGIIPKDSLIDESGNVYLVNRVA